MGYTRYVAGLFVFAFCFLACQHDAPSEIAAIPTEATEIQPNFIRYTTVRDGDFCRHKSASQCFTLVIGIQAPQLEKNLTLNTLAMSLGAEKFRLPLLRACQKGLDAYALGHQGLNRTIRNKLFSCIKETRCIFDYIISETYELPELAESQYGMAVRLSNWNIRGNSSELRLSPLLIEVSSATLDVSYRNTMIFSKPQGEAISRWSPFLSKDFRPLGGFTPLATRGFNLGFNRSIMARFVEIDNAESLAVVLEYIRNADFSKQALQYFFSEAAGIARGFVSGQATQSSLAIVALGIDALKAIRKEDLSKLGFASKDAINNIEKNLGDGEVIDSATNAIFADSHQYLPSKLIDDAFWNSHGDQLLKSLNLHSATTRIEN